MSYCAFVQSLPPDNVHRRYHDHAYGFPIRDDDGLFERLILEINQAGLSWETILRKAERLHQAYDGFRVDVVAGYGEAERQRLLLDAGIIRNRLKIDAAIENARRIQALRATHGSFGAWLDQHHPLQLPAWVAVFKRTFRFVGTEICKEFLMSSGYLPGAHDPDCPIHAQIVALDPPWWRSRSFFAVQA